MITDDHRIMPRLTVTFDEDLYEWIEAEAERRDRSKSWVVKQSVADARGDGASRITDHQSDDHRIDDHRTGDPVADIVDAVENLADRVAELEDAHESGHENARAPERPSEGQTTQRGRDATAEGTGVGDLSTTDAEYDVIVGDDDLRDRAGAVLDDLNVPGRSAATERARRKAILWAWEYLREHETAESRDIANATFGEFFEDPDLGYSTNQRYPGYGLWDNCVRDALKQLPGVNAPGERGKNWRFDFTA